MVSISNSNSTWRHFWKSSLNIHWRAGRDRFQRRKLEYQHMLPRKSVVMQNPITETWNNRSYHTNFLFLYFSLNPHVPQAARQYFRELTSVLFPPRIHRHQLTIRFAYVCHLFTISPGRECNQFGWKQMQPIRHDEQIRTDWDGQISIRRVQAFNTDIDNRFVRRGSFKVVCYCIHNRSV